MKSIIPNICYVNSHMLSSLPSVDFLDFTALYESALFESLRRE